MLQQAPIATAKPGDDPPSLAIDLPAGLSRSGRSPQDRARPTGRLFQRLATIFCLVAVVPLIFLWLLLSATVRTSENRAVGQMADLAGREIQSSQKIFGTVQRQSLNRMGRQLASSSRTIVRQGENKNSGILRARLADTGTNLDSLEENALHQATTELADRNRNAIRTLGNHIASTDATRFQEARDEVQRISSQALSNAIILANQQRARLIAQVIGEEVDRANTVATVASLNSTLRESASGTLLRATLNSILRRYPDLFSRLSVVDAAGDELAAVAPGGPAPPAPKALYSGDSFLEALHGATPRPGILDGPTAGAPSLNLFLPLVDGDRVLAASIPLAHLYDSLIQRGALPPGSQGSQNRFVRLFDERGLEITPGAHSLARLNLTTDLRRKGYSAGQDPISGKVLIAYEPIPDLDWSVLVETPVDEAYKTSRAMQARLSEVASRNIQAIHLAASSAADAAARQASDVARPIVDDAIHEVQANTLREQSRAASEAHREAMALATSSDASISQAMADATSSASADFNNALRARISLAQQQVSDETQAARAQLDRDIEGTALLMLLMVLMLALCSASALARGIVRPIERLVDGVNAFAEGRAHDPVQIRTRDEIQSLASAFNAMEERLESSRARLQATNETLALEKNRIETILACMPDGLLLLDPENRVAMLNPAARRMLRIDPDTTPSTLAEAGLPAAVSAALERPALPDAAHITVDPEFIPVLLRGDQAQRVLRVTAASVTHPDGTWLGAVKLLRDVTREKQVEEMKSEFISIVSHELRTPLTSIRSFSEILLSYEVPDPQTQQEFLQIINDESERLTRLINDFLDIAKIESGQFHWRMAEIDVAALARSAAHNMAGAADQAGLDILCVIENEIPSIWGDADRILQVLINLTGNAIKFTQKGAVHLRVRRAGDSIEVSVADTGVGIFEADLERVFDRFYQAGNIVTDKPAGSGLGLAICKQIVERHGGRIWVNSQPGRGSVFTFSLPLTADQPTPPIRIDDASPESAALVSSPAPAAAITAAGMSGAARFSSIEQNHRRTVLVVDDQSSARETLRSCLEGEGYDVLEAGNGWDALRIARELRPDLITLDLIMPAPTGFEIARNLADDRGTAGIPIVVVTAVDAVDPTLPVKPAAYFHKPFDRRNLLHAVRTALGSDAA